jgi:hypothetical protein
VGDTFSLFNGNVRLDAEGARWVGGAEIKATIRIFNGDLLIESAALNLNIRSAKRQLIQDLKTSKDFTLADSALVTLENFIRGRLPRPGRDDGPASLTDANAPPATAACGEQTVEVLALATDSNLLERITHKMREWGWVGDPRPPLLGYVGLTSCLLIDPARPMNLAFVSQAGTGKNHAVDAGRALVPEERYYLQRAGSEKSLIYVTDSFQYRMVIFAEADSIPEEGPAASAIRSLASDNVLAYDVPEQNPETNKFETRRINKPGPTGLMTTSTRSLQHQLGTRVLEVHLHDDAAQTGRVMAAQASSVDGTPRSPFDASVAIAFQRWLAATGPHRVVVPFAPALATLVPTVAVRMRRDFSQLLACIRSIALLYSCQRERLPDGAIIATLDDYVAARDLLAPVFDSVATEGVTDAVRDTVDAVPPGVELTMTALQVKLTVSKSTVSWRVGRALKGGWLHDLELRKGHPKRLVRGEPMPDVITALPTVDRVREVFECGRSELTVTADRTYSDVFECSNGNGERPAALCGALVPMWPDGPDGWVDPDDETQT